jgi:hypothetical protein
VDSLAVKDSSCKKLKEMEWHLYILEELWPKKELRAGEVLKVDTGCIVGFTKDVDYDIEFIGGIKNYFLEKVYSMHPSRPGTCMYNRYHSADSQIELLLQHQKQVVIAEVKEVYLADCNLLDGDNRFKV